MCAPLECRRKIPLYIYSRMQAHDVQCNRRRMLRRGWGVPINKRSSRPWQRSGTPPTGSLASALSPAVEKSGRRRHLLSPRRRWRSMEKRWVIDLVSEHHVEADQELARDGDLRTGTATSMEHGVVEPIQIRVAFDRRLARLAEHVPKEGIALFGNPAQPVFARRGLDRRGQPDVTHHVLARGEADHRPQHEHRREG